MVFSGDAYIPKGQTQNQHSDQFTCDTAHCLPLHMCLGMRSEDKPVESIAAGSHKEAQRLTHMIRNDGWILAKGVALDCHNPGLVSEFKTTKNYNQRESIVLTAFLFSSWLSYISMASRCSIILATNLGNYIIVTFKVVRTLNSTMTVYNPFSLKCLIFFSYNPDGLAFK